MSISYGKSMVGTIESVTTTMPFIRPPLPHRAGMLLGINDRFRTIVCMDPHGAKADDRTFATSYEIEGQVGTGKSALAKQLIRQANKLKAADDAAGGEPVPARIIIHDRKMGEYDAISDKLRSRVVRFSPQLRFNPFGIPMGVEHMVDLGIELAETAKRTPLTGYVPLAITIAINKMAKSGQKPSVERAAACCLALTGADLADHFDLPTTAVDVAANGIPGVSTMSERLTNRLGQYKAERVGSINLEEFLDDAGRGAGYLQTVRGGMFGGVIGGEGDSYADLTQRIVVFRWDDTSKRAIDAIEGGLFKWRTIAKNNMAHPELKKLISHFEFGDEDHKEKSTMRLRFESEAARETRALPTASFKVTQYADNDRIMAGGSDPERQGLVAGIRNATAGRITFKMPDNDDTREHLVNAGYTELEVDAIIDFPNHRAAFKLPGRPTMFFDTVMPKSDLDITYSNVQTDKMVAVRTSAHDNPEYLKRLALLEGRPIQETHDETE